MGSGWGGAGCGQAGRGSSDTVQREPRGAWGGGVCGGRAMCTHGSPARRARRALGASGSLQKPRAQCLVPGPGANSGPGWAPRGAGLGTDGPALTDPPPHPATQGAGPGASARVCPAPTLTAAPQQGPRRTEGGAPGVQGVRPSRWASGSSGAAPGDAEGDAGKRGVGRSRKALRTELPCDPATPPAPGARGPGAGGNTRPHASPHTCVHRSRRRWTSRVQSSPAAAEASRGPRGRRVECEKPVTEGVTQHPVTQPEMSRTGVSTETGRSLVPPRGAGSRRGAATGRGPPRRGGECPRAGGRRSPLGWTLQVHCLARGPSRLSCEDRKRRLAQGRAEGGGGRGSRRHREQMAVSSAEQCPLRRAGAGRPNGLGRGPARGLAPCLFRRPGPCSGPGRGPRPLRPHPRPSQRMFVQGPAEQMAFGLWPGSPSGTHPASHPGSRPVSSGHPGQAWPLPSLAASWPLRAAGSQGAVRGVPKAVRGVPKAGTQGPTPHSVSPIRRTSGGLRHDPSCPSRGPRLGPGPRLRQGQCARPRRPWAARGSQPGAQRAGGVPAKRLGPPPRLSSRRRRPPTTAVLPTAGPHTEPCAVGVGAGGGAFPEKGL